MVRPARQMTIDQRLTTIIHATPGTPAPPSPSARTYPAYGLLPAKRNGEMFWRSPGRVAGQFGSTRPSGRRVQDPIGGFPGSPSPSSPFGGGGLVGGQRYR